MGCIAYWPGLAKLDLPQLDAAAEPDLQAASGHFLNALRAARANVAAEGFRILLSAYDSVSADDPYEGLSLRA